MAYLNAGHHNSSTPTTYNWTPSTYLGKRSLLTCSRAHSSDPFDTDMGQDNAPLWRYTNVL